MDEYSPMVRDKLVWLVDRLEQLIIEDGRQATTFRVTIRDCIRDKDKKFHKESRQGKVAPRLFFLEKGGMRASAKTELVDIGLSVASSSLRPFRPVSGSNVARSSSVLYLTRGG